MVAISVWFSLVINNIPSKWLRKHGGPSTSSTLMLYMMHIKPSFIPSCTYLHNLYLVFLLPHAGMHHHKIIDAVDASVDVKEH